MHFFIATNRKGTPWRWGKEQKNAFQTPKLKFLSEAVLAQWHVNRETVLEADSSGFTLGEILLQKQEDGSSKPEAYFSRKLTCTEINYDIYDKKLLAVIACLKNGMQN